MQKKTFRTVGGATAVAGTAVAALGIGTIVGALLRDAFGADRASDDGPDDLLAPADHHESGRHRVTTPDGTTLNVVHYGTDDPEDDPDADIVVAVHGWTCNTAYWTPQINHLAAGVASSPMTSVATGSARWAAVAPALPCSARISTQYCAR